MNTHRRCHFHVPVRYAMAMWRVNIRAARSMREQGYGPESYAHAVNAAAWYRCIVTTRLFVCAATSVAELEAIDAQRAERFAGLAVR